MEYFDLESHKEEGKQGGEGQLGTLEVFRS